MVSNVKFNKSNLIVCCEHLFVLVSGILHSRIIAGESQQPKQDASEQENCFTSDASDQAYYHILLSVAGKNKVTTPRRHSCGWWNIIWTTYSDTRFKKTFKSVTGNFYIAS